MFVTVLSTPTGVLSQALQEIRSYGEGSSDACHWCNDRLGSRTQGFREATSSLVVLLLCELAGMSCGFIRSLVVLLLCG
jgi:hypothetical protein